MPRNRRVRAGRGAWLALRRLGAANLGRLGYDPCRTPGSRTTDGDGANARLRAPTRNPAGRRRESGQELMVSIRRQVGSRTARHRLLPRDPHAARGPARARAATLNQSIAERKIKNRDEAVVEEPLEQALMTRAGKLAYPIRDGIPVLLEDEAMPLAQIEGPMSATRARLKIALRQLERHSADGLGRASTSSPATSRCSSTRPSSRFARRRAAAGSMRASCMRPIAAFAGSSSRAIPTICRCSRAARSSSFACRAPDPATQARARSRA